MARAGPKTRQVSGRVGGPAGSWLWLQGLACGALLAFATPVALLAGVLLAPAAVAVAADTAPGRPVARSVGLASFAFTITPVWHLVLSGRGMASAVEMVMDPTLVAPAWLAGACGWALSEVLPVVLCAWADMRAAARTAALTAEEAALRRDWDLPATDDG